LNFSYFYFIFYKFFNNPNFIELKNLKINNYLKKIILNINHD